MDGRRFRRWALCGAAAAALAGCKTSTPDPVGGGAIGPVTKSSWGDKKPAAAAATGVPTDFAADDPSERKKGVSPEAQVAIADTWVAAATSDPPPQNRDQLLDKARQVYQGILKKDAKNGPATLGMARMYARLGERERAVEMYRAYMKRHPGDHAVMQEVAAAHARWKDMNGAVAWYDEALKADPQNRTYKKNRGFCLALAGRWDEGLASLTQVMPEAEARFYIAQVLYQTNQPEYSRQQLQAAIQLDPNFGAAREILAAMDAGGRPLQPPADPDPVQQAGFNNNP